MSDDGQPDNVRPLTPREVADQVIEEAAQPSLSIATLEKVKLEPGDVVLVQVEETLDPETVQTLALAFKATFPDNRTLILHKSVEFTVYSQPDAGEGVAAARDAGYEIAREGSGFPRGSQEDEPEGQASAGAEPQGGGEGRQEESEPLEPEDVERGPAA
jgi:hypothetical protein